MITHPHNRHDLPFTTLSGIIDSDDWNAPVFTAFFLKRNFMGTIKLQNIRTFSYHGCLVEEGKIGSDYRVDLEVKTDLRKSSETDELSDTVCSFWNCFN